MFLRARYSITDPKTRIIFTRPEADKLITFYINIFQYCLDYITQL